MKEKPGYDIIPAGFDYSIIEHIESICKDNDIEPVVIFSIIKVESEWNPLAYSSSHDSGLMQLNTKYIPYFIKSYGDKDKKYNPKKSSFDNVEIGIKHFKTLLDMFKGDYIQAIIAYNAGATAVKSSKIPRSSVSYLKKVLTNLPESVVKNII